VRQNALQCVAVRYNALQCVAVCCCVLQSSACNFCSGFTNSMRLVNVTTSLCHPLRFNLTKLRSSSAIAHQMSRTQYFGKCHQFNQSYECHELNGSSKSHECKKFIVISWLLYFVRIRLLIEFVTCNPVTWKDLAARTWGVFWYKSLWMRKLGKHIRSTSNQSSKPCEVAQYPQQKDLECVPV